MGEVSIWHGGENCDFSASAFSEGIIAMVEGITRLKWAEGREKMASFFCLFCL